MASLRQIAKELAVSHTLLVLWRQGKRKLAPELEARYHQFVTSGYNDEELLRSTVKPKSANVLGVEEPQRGFEPTNLPITSRLRYHCATGAFPCGHCHSTR